MFSLFPEREKIETCQTYHHLWGDRMLSPRTFSRVIDSFHQLFMLLYMTILLAVVLGLHENLSDRSSRNHCTPLSLGCKANFQGSCQHTYSLLYSTESFMLVSISVQVEGATGTPLS